MGTNQELHITLPSNVETKIGIEENSMTSFKTTFKKRLIFPPNEDWRVGVSEVIYTKSWYNVRKSRIIQFLLENGTVLDFYNNLIDLDQFENGCVESSCNILKKGYYDDIFILVEKINRAFTKFKDNFEVLPNLELDKEKNLVKIKFGIYKAPTDEGISFKCIPLFGKEIDNILGLVLSDGTTVSENVYSNDENMENTTRVNDPSFTKIYLDIFLNRNSDFHIVRRVADINAGFYSLFLYTNIIEDNFVGDEYVPLLRVLPIRGNLKFGSVVKETFDFPHFKKLQSRDFDTIHIEIRDDTGSKIPFEIGRVIVKLVFRKYD